MIKVVQTIITLRPLGITTERELFFKTTVDLITDRVRSTTGGYIFTGVCLFTRGGGGGRLPHLHPIIFPSHNTSTGPMSFPGGVPHLHPQTLVRCPFWEEGTSVTHSRSRWYPPPMIGKQREYLIRRGRYASCVHAGGLSCLMWLLFQALIPIVVSFLHERQVIAYFLWLLNKHCDIVIRHIWVCKFSCLMYNNSFLCQYFWYYADSMFEEKGLTLLKLIYICEKASRSVINHSLFLNRSIP